MATLENIAKSYGMHDYYDQQAGKIYELSKAIDNGDGTLLIPVKSVLGDNLLIGYAKMQKEE